MAKKETDETIQSAYRVGYLLAGYIRGQLTDVEMKELNEWRQKKESNERLFQEYTDPSNVEKLLAEYASADTELYLEKTKDQIREIKLTARKAIWRSVAAGVIVLFIISGIWYLLRKDNSSNAIAGTEDLEKDIAAMLVVTGSNSLDITGDLDTVLKSGTHLIVKDRELSYQSAKLNEAHLLAVPVGRSFKVVLQDGSKVWLNAGSSVQYRTLFSEEERRIRLDGEAYFEVAENKEKPFRVEFAGGEIEALGTAFNVKAYEGDESFSTLLNQGKIKLKLGKRQIVLKPGQQVMVKGSNIVTDEADTEMPGWSRNEFVFDDTPLKEVMNELARWYGVKIEYKMTTEPRFNFTISRDKSLLEILSLMEKTNEAHFVLDDHKVTVTH